MSKEKWDWEKHAHRRQDRFGLVEHICEHGVGHPNRGSATWIAQALVGNRLDGEATYEDIIAEYKAQMVHGCDGCCGDPDFPDWQSSLIMAHDIIRSQHRLLAEMNEEINELSEAVETK